MAELLLIVSLLAVFVFGFYLMSRLDRFLEENRKALLKLLHSANLEFHHLIDCQAYVYLWKNHPLASEILCEIRRFRETHGNVDIILSDGQKNDF